MAKVSRKVRMSAGARRRSGSVRRRSGSVRRRSGSVKRRSVRVRRRSGSVRRRSSGRRVVKSCSKRTLLKKSCDGPTRRNRSGGFVRDGSVQHFRIGK